MTPNFDINQNRAGTQDNSMSYSRMSYKPSNDTNKYDAYKPESTTPNESLTGTGLNSRPYDSASKQQDRFQNETNYQQSYLNKNTDGSGQQHSSSIPDYKAQTENNYDYQRKSIEDYQAKQYQGRYDREATTNLGESFKSRSPAKQQDPEGERSQPTTQHRPTYTQSSYAPRNIDEPSSELR